MQGEGASFQESFYVPGILYAASLTVISLNLNAVFKMGILFEVALPTEKLQVNRNVGHIWKFTPKDEEPCWEEGRWEEDSHTIISPGSTNWNLPLDFWYENIMYFLWPFTSACIDVFVFFKSKYNWKSYLLNNCLQTGEWLFWIWIELLLLLWIFCIFFCLHLQRAYSIFFSFTLNFWTFIWHES